MLSIPFVLVGLHRVLFITNGRLATTPPPSSVSHADIFAPLTGDRDVGVPKFQRD